MKRSTKILLLVATALVLTGCTLFAFGMTKLNWDFSELSTVEYETNIYEIDDAFENISVETYCAQIVIVPSNDETAKVECIEETNIRHTVTVENNTLTVTATEIKPYASLFNHIGIVTDSPQITIYLPKREYATLILHNNVGDMEIPQGFTFQNIELSSETGDILLCAFAENTIKIKTDTGDVQFQNCDAAEILVTSDTGDITGNFLTDKIFTAVSDCGDVDIPNTATGGKCEITTDTGDIRIKIK